VKLNTKTVKTTGTLPRPRNARTRNTNTTKPSTNLNLGLGETEKPAQVYAEVREKRWIKVLRLHMCENTTEVI
jgi:hypothetical protein